MAIADLSMTTSGNEVSYSFENTNIVRIKPIVRIWNPYMYIFMPKYTVERIRLAGSLQSIQNITQIITLSPLKAPEACGQKSETTAQWTASNREKEARPWPTMTAGTLTK